MTLPTYEDNPFWEPQNEAEAVELAIGHQENGLDPKEYAGAFGDYVDFASADLPWDASPFVPVADLSDTSAAADLAIRPGDVVERGSDSGTGAVAYALVVEVDDTNQQVKVEPLEIGADGMLVSTGERPVMWDLDVLEPSDKQLSKAAAWPNQTRPVSPDASTERNLSHKELEGQWKEFRARYLRKDEAGPTDLTDDDLYTLWKSSTSSGEEFANLCEDLESRGCSIEFSSEEPTVGVSDEELWQRYEDVKSGEAGRRHARRAVEDKFEERLAYWREAAKRGEVLPRDLEGLI